MTHIVVTLRMSTHPDLTPEALAAHIGERVALWLPDETVGGVMSNIAHEDIGGPTERMTITLDLVGGGAATTFINLQGATLKVERHGPLHA